MVFARISFIGLVAFIANPQPLVTQYCAGCHSPSAKAGGLVLEGVGANDARVWEKVVRKVRSGEMPPAGAPRPSAEALAGFTDSLIARLDSAKPYIGRPVVRRLSRGEYSRAVRDLLDLNTSFESELPPDGIAAGFDNIADALSMSPVLLERYLKTARKISNLAVGTGDDAPVTSEYMATGTQAEWQGPDFPYGSRGGVSVRHYFPREGDYDLRAFIGSLRGNLMTPVEGVRFFQIRTHLKAGLHHFVVTFPNDFAQREDVVPNLAGPGGVAAGGPSDILNTAIKPTIDFLMDGRRVKMFEIQGATPAEAVTGYEAGPPMLKKAEITGPFNPKPAGLTPSRGRIFVCRTQDAACAGKIITALVTRAYRRDVQPDDLQPILATYNRVRAKQGFDEAIAAAIADILVSPDFLFRLELTPNRLSQFELATRLSFFLWSSIPDDALLAAARQGTVAKEVRRMITDPKAETLVDNFAAQWLGFRDPVVTKPDFFLYPEFDSAVKHDYEQESRLFVRSVLRGDRSVLDLVNADYTYLNERLAKVYGIPGVTGTGFRRYQFPAGTKRGGLLGQGYVLLMTSHNNRTSPIVRGKWILQNLFNAEPPPPPAGIPPLEDSAKGAKTLTTRQQVELHRKNPVCASCHARMDPLGFALENYDVIGRWRVKDAGGPIDASGKLPNGESVDGLDGLHQYFDRHSGQFVEAIVERLMTYALGRELDPRDQPTVRKIVREAKPGNYKFRDLVEGVVNSAPFQMRPEIE